jgi:two-component system sensor histidine kinase KdpD
MDAGTTKRPTPDELLARVSAEAARAERGRRKVFFGYAAGVGKTYAMLEAARREQADGRDVVVGYVEPHGRVETEALLEGLEALPPLMVSYRGVTLLEFDLDAALDRHPSLLIVDELAHSNAEGCRHAKRWQDVEELLDAGIDVFTTVNVQHIESLNDIVGQITGVIVRETVPDSVLFEADEVELVDITPDELLERLRAGKVYVPTQAAQAMQKFFHRGNLQALRELALRRTADRVNVDVQTARAQASAAQTWPTTERLLVCVGPSPSSAKVIRTTRRMADALHAGWIAATVSTPASEGQSDAKRRRLMENLQLAERLGAETVTLSGTTVPAALVDYAVSRNVTKIVIGKSDEPRRWLRRRTLVDELLDRSGDIDVYVIRGIRDSSPPPARRLATTPRPWSLLPAAGILATATGIAALFDLAGLSEGLVVSVYLLAVFLVALWCGRREAVTASLVSVLLFDVLFVAPRYSLAVSDTQYVVTFAVMLVVALLTSELTSRVKRQADASSSHAARTEALYRLSRQMTGLINGGQIVEQSEQIVSEVFGGHAVIFTPDRQGQLRPVLSNLAAFAATAAEFATAQWVFDRNQPAGLGTDTLPSASSFYLPLATPQGPGGVLAFQPRDPQSLNTPETRRLLETFATQIALALERGRLAEQTHEARVEVAAEQLRSSLLSSVSHDLKTPLAVIAGASSSLLEASSLDADTQRQLLETIAEETLRLNRLLENILQMSKLDAGHAAPNKEWHVLEEIVGSALHRTRRELQSHLVDVHVPANLPLVQVDGLLIEQLFINLLENAARHTPEGSRVRIEAAVEGPALRVSVLDNGPGLPAGSEEKIFEKFYRGTRSADSARGSGLGLAICRAIAKAHGGEITAANRSEGGAEFALWLPVAKDAPRIPVEGPQQP